MNVFFDAVVGPLLDQHARAHVVCVAQNGLEKDLAAYAALFGPLKAYLDEQQFAGKSGQLAVIPLVSGSNTRYLMIGGLGKANDSIRTVEAYRRSLGAAVQQARRLRLESLAVQIPGTQLCARDANYMARETAITATMAFYEFDTFKKTANGKAPVDLKVTMVAETPVDAAMLAYGSIVGQATNEARHWVDMPSQAKFPQDLAHYAPELAKETKLKCTVFDAKQIKDMGMGGLLAVSSGSAHECRLVTLEYKSATKDAPTIALVGKGVTFDSGGLDLKPADAMDGMKDDMSGAAAVLATMRAVAKIKPAINVIGVTPLAENMPSGSAYRPGDIVTFCNGKTAEIGNTDAEGRLILADALAYTVKTYKPAAIFDIATLTGACRLSLGVFFSGIFSEHDDLIKRVHAASDNSGDAVWRLPLTDDYKRAIVGDISDICNTSKKKYYAGASTAAAFLQHFVGETPWVHIDIAGTAANVPDVAYYRPNTGTGVGVRLFVELLTNWQ